MAHVGTHGVERHHPNPDFYYQRGGGLLLDLGPYSSSHRDGIFVWLDTKSPGMSNRSMGSRLIENGPRNGEFVPVEVDTHSLSLIEFSSGAAGRLTLSFDVWDKREPSVLRFYGSDGTLPIPDPRSKADQQIILEMSCPVPSDRMIAR